MRTKKPIAERDLKVHTVEAYPYMIVKPNQMALPPEQRGPWYFQSYKKALNRLSADMDVLESIFKNLSSESVRRIGDLRAEAEQLPLEGGTVEGVIDDVSGVRYKATLVKREGF